MKGCTSPSETRTSRAHAGPHRTGRLANASMDPPLPLGGSPLPRGLTKALYGEAHEAQYGIPRRRGGPSAKRVRAPIRMRVSRGGAHRSRSCASPSIGDGSAMSSMAVQSRGVGSPLPMGDATTALDRESLGAHAALRRTGNRVSRKDARPRHGADGVWRPREDATALRDPAPDQPRGVHSPAGSRLPRPPSPLARLSCISGNISGAVRP